MKLNDILWLGVKGIWERKLRTALTIICVVIGVAAIVALVSLVSGISASITNSLSSIGPTTLYMSPSGGHIFTAADVAEIESLPNVSTVIPMLSFSGNTTIGGQNTAVTVIGIDNYSLGQALGKVNVNSGSVYQNSDLPFALVGYSIAYPQILQVASGIQINEPMYVTAIADGAKKTVSLVPTGILNEYGSSAFISPDTSIFISLQDAELITNRYSYNIILVKATNTSTVAPLDALLTDIYGSNARILSVQAIAQTVSSITGSLGILLGAIAGISLLVAGISILSIMMVSVSERTHEIGILKSIGFKRRDVMMLFLSEALIIGLAGGLIGVAVGAGGAYAVPALTGSGAGGASAAPSGASSGGFAVRAGSGGGGFGAGATNGRFAGGQKSFGTTPSGGASPASLSFTPQVSVAVVLIAIFIAILVSVVSTLYPAWKASTIDPIKALRSE